MFQRVRKHLTPSTAIAFIALVFALTGGAFAASGHGGSSGSKATASTTVATVAKAKAKAKTKAGPRGPAGPKGATGATGATGPAGATGATGATGPGGAQGPQGTAGTNGIGTEGPVGKEGPQGNPGTNGTTGFTKYLPKGETETGTFTFSTKQSSEEPNTPEFLSGSPISFSIPLEKPITATRHVTTLQQERKECTGSNDTQACEETQKEVEAECPGTVEVPTAAEGHLCVYEGGIHLPAGASKLKIQKIVPPSVSLLGNNGTGTSGAIVVVLYEGPEEELGGGANLNGSWAVTAPAVTAP